ncbi:MAG: PglZ domain-containing protein [Saprospiraceae bacterium]|nr:PglZ domain-containing protein [Candidatus Opimibacter skivensis]MBL0007796.1 PglZ domain-containing protein [Candidatus Opimibacter skivensis]HQW26891.1 PglZ domain-containing protein [Saprospiraceae bacterium]
MDRIKILWADDEIDLLKPQLFFLEKKGYNVTTVSNGHDAIDEFEKAGDVDIVFLDESMPGLSGLETMQRLKAIKPSLPIVMITKNEAENIMEEALGSQIDDYLIKPVNPNQILLTLKKIVDNKRLVREKTSSDYQVEFRNIMMEINSGLDVSSWAEAYKKIVNWELKIDTSRSEEMIDILSMQKSEANSEFSKFVTRHYLTWIKDKEKAPLMSPDLMSAKILPHLNDKQPVVFLLLDNLRWDQWKMLEPIITELYEVEEESFFYSILPTSTQYSRNSIFAGMMPADIAKNYPDMWVEDFEEGGKNMHEAELLEKQLQRKLRKEIKWQYLKITNAEQARDLGEKALDLMHNNLIVIVYNFIDMLSHARTEMEVLKELAGDEKAYRSLTYSWFVNSPVWTALRKMAAQGIKLIIGTDHGTIRVKQPSKVIGDRNTTTNLRYKMGKNLQYDVKDVLEIKKPEEAGLPRPNLSSSYIFAKEDKYFLYPNNYNHYNTYYRNTFQHGGISLEEMICPIIRLSPKTGVRL